MRSHNRTDIRIVQDANNSVTIRTVISQPRFSIAQAIIAALLVVAIIFGGGRAVRAIKQHFAPHPPIQAMSVISLDPELADTGPLAWIINPLRVACTEWERDDGPCSWLTGPLAERGCTPSDIEALCDWLAEAPNLSP